MIKQPELNALDKFLFNQQEAAQYLIRYGHDPLLINKEITHSYDYTRNRSFFGVTASHFLL